MNISKSTVRVKIVLSIYTILLFCENNAIMSLKRKMVKNFSCCFHEGVILQM